MTLEVRLHVNNILCVTCAIIFFGRNQNITNRNDMQVPHGKCAILFCTKDAVASDQFLWVHPLISTGRLTHLSFICLKLFWKCDISAACAILLCKWELPNKSGWQDGFATTLIHLAAMGIRNNQAKCVFLSTQERKLGRRRGLSSLSKLRRQTRKRLSLVSLNNAMGSSLHFDSVFLRYSLLRTTVLKICPSKAEHDTRFARDDFVRALRSFQYPGFLLLISW